MKYLCVVAQKERSCKYGIGCGVEYLVIEATDEQDATDQVIKKLSFEDYENGDSDPSYYGKDGEQELAHWRLYEISKEFDLLPLLHGWQEEAKQRENAQKEAELRAQYEQLKRHFEK